MRRATPHADGASGTSGGAVSVSGLPGAVLVAHLLAPVALAWGCARAVASTGGVTPLPAGLAALLFGVTLAYVGDRLHDLRDGGPRGEAMRRHVPGLLALAGAAAAGLALAATRLPTSRLAALATCCALALAYRRASRIPLLKTAVLACAWAVGSGVLALRDAAPWEAAASVALVIGGAGMLCDIKDAAADRATGTWTLATRAGETTTRLAAAAMGVTAALLARDASPGLHAAGWVTAALACLPGAALREVEGVLAVDAALAAAVLLGG